MSEASEGSFGALVRLAREFRGWTLRELAERSGVPYKTLIQIELGYRAASLPTAVRLARAMRVRRTLRDVPLG
jgi:transcriptional regulator with XRE-family HTH domain